MHIHLAAGRFFRNLFCGCNQSVRRFSHRGENDNDLASGLLFFDAALCYIADVCKICDGASAKFHYSQHNSFDLFPF